MPQGTKTFYLPMQLNDENVLAEVASDTWQAINADLAGVAGTSGIGFRRSKNLEDKVGLRWLWN